MEHILKVPNKVVYRSIEEVLDGNYLALEKKVNEDYIKRLIDSFQIDNPDPADLYFLSRLCICGERTVIKNQNAIFNNFYRRDMDCNEDSVPDNKFWFREDQKKMQILSRISHFPPQYRTLSELYR